MQLAIISKQPRGSVEKYNYKLALKIPLDKSKKKVCLYILNPM